MALPLFGDTASGDLNVQIYQMNGPITAFARVAETISVPLPQGTEIYAEVGGEPLIAVFDEYGALRYGPRSDLGVVVRQCASHPKASDAFRISAYEVVGDIDQVRRHRQRACESITKFLGMQSSRYFKDSVATDIFWNLLEQNARSAEAASRFRTVRGTASARMHDGRSLVDFGLIDPSDFTIESRDFEALIDREMVGLASAGVRLKKADLSGYGGSAPTYGELIAAIAASPRQEERVAILMRIMILFPKEGINVAQYYPHHSAYEKAAAGKLFAAVSRERDITSNVMERILSGLTRQLISDAYPMRKGEVIFYFASHLSDFPLVRGQILDSFTRSNALSVNMLSEQINNALFGSKYRRPT